MRLTIAMFLLVAATLFAQPTQSDRYRYAPLVATAKLWNMVRYLDPRVTGDSTAWDSALLAALPRIEEVHSDEDLAVALDAMLATLHDPSTRIAAGLPGKALTVQSPDTDSMVIHAGNGDMSGSLGAGLMLQMGIPQTSSVVWDLRGTRMPYAFAGRPDLRQLSLAGIGYAYREYSGYPAQDGTESPYYSSLKIVEPRPPANAVSGGKLRQVYLVDKDSAIPVRAIVDQFLGRSAIISEDPPRPLQAGYTVLHRVLGKVIAEVRVAEYRYPDGTTEYAPSRVVLNRGDEAVKAAIHAANFGDFDKPGERPKFQALSAAFHDMPYPDEPFPSRPMRILAAMRMWGVLHYFHPYVSMMGSRWDDVLVQLLPKFAEAKDAREYYLAASEMAARSGDPNSYVAWRAGGELFGPAMPPLEVRFVDNQPVITRVFEKSSAAQAGDIILKIDGKPVEERINELARYVAAPSPVVLRSLTGRFLLSGAPRTVTLTVRGKNDASRDVSVAVRDLKQKAMPASRQEEAVRTINGLIGYVDLEQVQPSDVDGIFDKLGKSSAIIFDLRGYPRDVAMTVASRLSDRSQPPVMELFRNVTGIGAGEGDIGFMQSESHLPPANKERYAGKTVALIDDAPFSLTGESAMCFKAANQTILIGGPAYPFLRGRTTELNVPGDFKLYFSGEIARWPGGKLVYPDGVQPDVSVRPTIAGIRDGKDEVLDAAVQYVEKKLASNQ